MTAYPTRRRLLLLASLAILSLGSAGVIAMINEQPPADLDLALAKQSDGGLYHTEITPSLSPLTTGTMHAWTISVTTPSGEPVEGATVEMDGGMPQHGHGLPTQPRTLRETAAGQYLVGGMKFNMPGWWTLTIDIDSAVGPDTVTFNVVL